MLCALSSGRGGAGKFCSESFVSRMEEKRGEEARLSQNLRQAIIIIFHSGIIVEGTFSRVTQKEGKVWCSSSMLSVEAKRRTKN